MGLQEGIHAHFRDAEPGILRHAVLIELSVDFLEGRILSGFVGIKLKCSLVGGIEDFLAVGLQLDSILEKLREGCRILVVVFGHHRHIGFEGGRLDSVTSKRQQ